MDGRVNGHGAFCQACESHERLVARDGFVICYRCDAYPKAVSLLFRETENERLCLAVSRKSDPSKFGLPGGKVDPGETFLEALAREVKEETGLTLYGTPVPVFIAVCRGKVDYLNATYRIERVQGIPHTDEPHTIEWVTREKLLEGPFAPYLRDMFTYLDGAA